MTSKAKCWKCAYVWQSRVKKPKACPRCKTRQDIRYGKAGRPKKGEALDE